MSRVMAGLRAFLIAGRSVWDEVAGFRFDFPAYAVAAAAAEGALRYHLNSPDLFHRAMHLDQDGVPYQVSRTFTSYNPAYVALYGLRALDAYSQGSDDSGRERFELQVSWLRSHALRRADGAIVWTYNFKWREHNCVLRPPWISSMAQGLAISALVRAHRLTGNAADLELARAAVLPFALGIAEGGVRDILANGAVYEEYAALPTTRVLDGFLFSLLGLYDLAIETSDAEVHALFIAGVRGLAAEMPLWDTGEWSWYGRRLYLAPPAYHSINRALLTAVATAAGNEELRRVAETWDPSRLSRTMKSLVYLRFVAGKQWSRVRDRVFVAPAVRKREAEFIER
jgi:hypothetical protein